MAGINKVILIGNLGQDPEARTFPDGGMLCNCSVATSESCTDKATGQKQERTEWHRVTVKGKLAEICAQYLRKGAKVYFEGQLQTRKWQAQDGTDRYSTEVVVGINGSMQMLDSADRSQQPQQQNYQQQQPAQQQNYQQQQQPAQQHSQNNHTGQHQQYGNGSYDANGRR